MEIWMHGAHQMHRQCADCYYRVGQTCKAKESPAPVHKSDFRENCEIFIRASIHFAFFQKIA